MRGRTLIFLILLLSLIPLVSIFITPRLFHSHDGLVHLARIAAYKKALSDGEFPVRWAGDLNYGYGMPLFNFIYQFPYLVACAFLFLGAGLVLSFKLSISLSFLLAGISMYLFAKELLEDEKKGFMMAVFYQFAPFRLVELLVRGSFGEMYAYSFAPLVLYFLVKFFKKNEIKYGIGIAFSTAFLVISHNALSLVFFGVAVLFTLILGKDFEHKLKSWLFLLLGLCLSAFYWVPALLEHKYTYGDKFMRYMYQSHFPPFINFFIPNFTNSSNLQTGGVAIQIGLFHVLAVFLGIYLLSKKINRQENKLVWLSLFLIIGSLFLMQPISAFIWERQGFLRQFQFPWRLLGLVALASSFCSLSFFHIGISNKKYFYPVIIFLTVISTAYYWIPPLGYYPDIKESLFWNYPLNTTYFGETDLIWSAGRAYSYPKSRVEVIDNKAVVYNFQKKTTLQTFSVQSENGAKLIDHTQYYPGWKVFVDGVDTPIEYQYQIYPGQLVFKIPPGKHSIRVQFSETKPRLISDLISLLSFITLIMYIIKVKLIK